MVGKGNKKEPYSLVGGNYSSFLYDKEKGDTYIYFVEVGDDGTMIERYGTFNNHGVISYLPVPNDIPERMQGDKK
jgi:hypothetical protein